MLGPHKCKVRRCLKTRKFARTPLARPANNRAKATNNPRIMAIDGRSQLGRRLHDLAESYAAQLGGWASLSDTMAANVRRAAEAVRVGRAIAGHGIAKREHWSDSCVWAPAIARSVRSASM